MTSFLFVPKSLKNNYRSSIEGIKGEKEGRVGTSSSRTNRRGGISMDGKRYKNEGQFLKTEKRITKNQLEVVKDKKKFLRNLRPSPNRIKI